MFQLNICEPCAYVLVEIVEKRYLTQNILRDRDRKKQNSEKIDRQTETDNRKIVKKRMKLEIKKEIYKQNSK